MERIRCDGDVDESTLAPIFEDKIIESVEPLYTPVSSGGHGAGGNYSQLIGAIVRLSAYKGFTAEWLDRALECHSARRVLGRIPSTKEPNDPFWLPQRTVDIEVSATRSTFNVFVRGGSIKDAEEILARANAFLEARRR